VALTKDRKTELIGNYKTHDSDTGSPEVQVAILSERISYLTEHFKSHAKDHHCAADSCWSAGAAGRSTTSSQRRAALR
jgi:ribosomal protein S15P/S13E